MTVRARITIEDDDRGRRVEVETPDRPYAKIRAANVLGIALEAVGMFWPARDKRGFPLRPNPFANEFANLSAEEPADEDEGKQ